MSLPPKAQRQTREDLPGAPEWVEKLLGAQNPFQEATGKALDKSLTFAQNIQSQQWTVDVVAPSPVWNGIATQGSPAPAFARSWVQYVDTAYPAVGFRLDATGRVYLRGIVSGGTATAGPMFYVPAAYLPAKDFLFTCLSNSAFGAGVVRVGTASVDFAVGSNAYFCLDNVSWEAASASAAPALPTGSGWPLTLKLSIPGAAWVQVVKVEDLSAVFGAQTGFGPVGPPEWTFDSTGGLVILGVPGLTPGRQYRLTLLAVSG